MLQKLLVNNFEQIKDNSESNVDFIKSYHEEINDGYFLKVDVQYLEKLHDPCNDLPLLPEKMKIEKVKMLVANLHNKTEQKHIRNLKQALNH